MGSNIVVGARLSDAAGPDSGTAYVFREVQGVWQEFAKLTANEGNDSDEFGSSVAIELDTAVVGAQMSGAGGPASGNAWVFGRIPTSGDCDGNGVPDECEIPGNDCNGNGVLDTCELLGDIDFDGDVDLDDSAILVTILLGVDMNEVHVSRADIDCSGIVDALDIGPFVEVLIE
jgi:FG-GAP repeat